MGFRDFISNRLFRKRLEAEHREFVEIRPPANPSRRYIDKLVRRLLDPEHAWAARGELELIGRPAAPALATAAQDPRYQRGELFGKVLELLAPHAPDDVASVVVPLIRSPAKEIRKTAALYLASLGQADSVPILTELLNDPDGYVRSYVATGASRAASAGRCDDTFRRGMYDALLAQCDQDWDGTLNDAAAAVIELDPARSAADFAAGPWLSPTNRRVHDLLKACNEAAVPLPEERLRELLDHALPRAVGERCYPNEYIAAEALIALTRTAGERARPTLEAALASDQPEIQEAAAKGLARVAGAEDPVNFVLGRLNAVGFAGLTPPQRVVLCTFWFDAEVCNGGLMQFFGNSTGNFAAETLEALRTLGHAGGLRALETAMSLVGPLAADPDRDRRLSAFEGRYDELKAAFDPLETAFYKTTGLFRQKMLLYATKNAEHFRGA